jgi:microcystin-dependent protein
MAISLTIFRQLLATAALVAPLVAGGPALAQSEPFIGQIGVFGFNFCPRGWAPADGRMMKIADNQALYSLLGTMYGGDGRTTFALPDLRGRVPVGLGVADGQTPKKQGEAGGAESVTLDVAQMPAHTHEMRAASRAANTASATGKVLARNRRVNVYSTSKPDVAMAGDTIGETGSGAPVPVRDPYLVMNWCVAVWGIYPSRS